MKNPKTELLEEPQWSSLIFGDGHFAMMQAGSIVKIIEGKRILFAVIKPHPKLRKAYNIREEELNDNGNIENYPIEENDLITLNPWDDSNRTFLYVKNYHHQETPLGERDRVLRAMLNQKDFYIWALEGELIHLSEMLNSAKTNPMEFAAMPLEIFKQITEGTIEALRTKKEKED